MKYTLVSDLHCDHPQPKTPPIETQLIIVAGDTGNGLIGLKMLNKWKRKGHTVFAVDGNHEHYSNAAQGRTAAETTAAFYAGLDQSRVLHLPEQKLKIIGTNGWYQVFDPWHWAGYMNDSRKCDLSGRQVNDLALADVAFVQRELETLWPDHRAIVVTHTAPCYESLDPKYEGSDGNPYYVNPDMTPLLGQFADRIAVWHHGHTHASVDVVKDGVRIITNPRGYPRENPSWTPSILEV